MDGMATAQPFKFPLVILKLLPHLRQLRTAQGDALERRLLGGGEVFKGRLVKPDMAEEFLLGPDAHAPRLRRCAALCRGGFGVFGEFGQKILKHKKTPHNGAYYISNL